MTLDQALQAGRRYHDAGDLQKAEQIYRQILAANPKHPHALHLLGRIAMQVGQFEAAITLIRQAIAAQTNYVEARYSLGLAQRLGNRTSDAIQTFRELIALSPDHFDARHSLAELLQDEGRSDEAIENYLAALALRPDSAEVLNNFAGAYQEIGQLDQAIDAFRRAVAIAPDSAAIHYNLGLALLLNGNLQEGFAEHEWRWQVDQLGLTRREFPQPRWDGSDPRDRRILLYCEQGYGDSIQFLRYVPILARQGARLILQLPQELVRLASTLEGADQIVPFGQPLPAFDVHLPLLSLPLVMGTTLQTIPAQVPYLQADPKLVSDWAARIDRFAAGKLKVGLTIAGRAEHWNDRNRSIPVSLATELTQNERVSFFSLQLAGSPLSNTIDLTADLHDFADTAAMIENLDLVICVDTAVAHLAGAMDKEVWLLLPFAPDWRWMRDRTDSPWYPSMKLFRQPTRGDWPAVLREAANKLAHFRR